jgi:CheY-specific phosphatase CheX
LLFSQFFGNYLLNQNILTKEQIISALEDTQNTRLKLGVLAINSGYMTSSQVARVHDTQVLKDKKFGDIAIELGYLTKEQVQELLNDQPKGYLLLGQAIIEKGFITEKDFESILNSYKKYYKYDNKLLVNGQEDSNYILNKVYDFSSTSYPNQYNKYVSLLINDLIRFIGDDFTPLNPEYDIRSTSYKVMSQHIYGDFENTILLFADETTLIHFAERYSGEELYDLNEYAESATQDFLNLINGLFTVNESNNQQVELSLEPPGLFETLTPIDLMDRVILPFQYPFGTIRFSLILK